MVQVQSLTEDAKIAVMQQRLTDDEITITRNTGLVNDMATTINRMEGIGISFGLALTVVQFMLFKAHQESRRQVKTPKLDDET